MSWKRKQPKSKFDVDNYILINILYSGELRQLEIRPTSIFASKHRESCECNNMSRYNTTRIRDYSCGIVNSAPWTKISHRLKSDKNDIHDEHKIHIIIYYSRYNCTSARAEGEKIPRGGSRRKKHHTTVSGFLIWGCADIFRCPAAAQVQWPNPHGILKHI